MVTSVICVQTAFSTSVVTILWDAMSASVWRFQCSVTAVRSEGNRLVKAIVRKTPLRGNDRERALEMIVYWRCSVLLHFYFLKLSY